MNGSRLIALAVALALSTAIEAARAAPVGSSFTYQGHLKDDGVPINGLVDFEFILYAAETGGSPLGWSSIVSMVNVVNGLFTVQPDFGSSVFNGDALWLEIVVTFPSVSGTPTTLSPRQPLNAVPYAHYALETGSGGFWEANADDISNTNSGQVGIGTTSPTWPLHVESSFGRTVFAENTASGGIGVYGEASNFTGGGFGVRGDSYGTTGGGLFGIAVMSTGINYGVYGQSQSDTGRGVYGFGANATGVNYGVYGQTNSSNGWAGYFLGRGYFSGDVGIGTTSPTATLEVTNSGGQHGIYAHTDYIAVRGTKTGNGSFPGVDGQTESTSSGASGVRGQVTSTTPGSGSAGVYGINAGTGSNGYGVRGTHAGSGAGVYGSSSTGPGGEFVGAENNGTNAALRIVSGGQTMLLDGNEIDAFVSGLYLNNNSALNVNIANGGGDVILAGGGGNVGIGASSPGSRLHILEFGSASLFSATQFGTGSGAYVSVNSSTNTSPALSVYNANASVAALQVTGTASVDVLEIRGADVAEKFPVSEPVKPGMVVAIDAKHPGKLCLARGACNRRVAGVVSGANGLPTGVVLGNLAGNDDAPPIALSGRVWVWCDATGRPIELGDLLTTSHTPGHAMKVSNYAKAQGAIIGKAMTALAGGRGLVLVLVSLQ